MARVFVSHIHEDESVAMPLQDIIRDELKLDSADVFCSADPTQIKGGEPWFDKIRNALETCDVLVLLLSGRAQRRAWVHFEAGAVWMRNKPVIPVCFGNSSKRRLMQPYTGMQALDLPTDLQLVLESLAHHLGVAAPEYTVWDLLRPHLTPPSSPFEQALEIMKPRNVLTRALEAYSDE